MTIQNSIQPIVSDLSVKLISDATVLPATTESIVLQESEQTIPQDSINEEEIIYTVRDLKKSTLRRLNEILTFLTIDEAKYENYKSPKKILRIKDSEGNSLRISEGKIPIDPFLSLARYFGI